MIKTLVWHKKHLFGIRAASLLFGLSTIVVYADPAFARPPAAAPVKAQTGGAAEILFDEAVALADAGKLEEACKKFEESERLEHASGTLYNLADCLEKTGRLASAWEAFNSVAVEAKQAGKTARAEEARRHADALKSRLSKLVIELSPAVAAIPGLVVERNGTSVDSDLWGKTVPVDAGDQTVVVSAPGKTPHRQTVVLREAATETIKVESLDTQPMPRQRVAAIAVGGVGVAAMLIGGVVGILANSKWNDAVDACKGSPTSPTACATPMQVANAQAIGTDARGLATISTIGLAIGGAGLATGAILWFLTPKEKVSPVSTSWHIVPAVGPSGFGAVFKRNF